MIIPTSGRLVLQKIKEEEKPQGLVIVPNSKAAQEKYKVVRISASDLATVPFPPTVSVVYIDKYKGVEITHGGETYLVVNDEDIIAYEAK